MALLKDDEDPFTGGVLLDRSQTHADLALSSVTRPEDTAGDSLPADWQALEHILGDDVPLTLRVIGTNRGGLLVEWRSVRGFVPTSQLIEALQPNGAADLNAYIGQSLLLRIIELNPTQNRLILSQRAALVQPGQRARLLEGLTPGSAVTGVVTNLCDFGAFIDLGGLEGLIHISELSWGRVNHPADLLKRGQETRVYVLDIVPEAGRIALSLKRLRPDPWQHVESRYAIGQMVEGTVTNVVDFGAFVRIEDGLEGLIHVSELAEGHFLHPRNVLSEGQLVHTRILTINAQHRRLGLSLRSLPGTER